MDQTTHVSLFPVKPSLLLDQLEQSILERVLRGKP